MKPYGMKRIEAIEWPDLEDLRAMGAPSRFGRRKAPSKAITRRTQKRRARKAAREECSVE